MGGFTVALQAAHHDNGLAFIFDMDTGCFLPAHQVGKLFVYDFDNLLRRGKAFHNLLPHGALGNLCAKIFGDLVVYIGLQQSHANLAHGGLDIGLTQFALAAQLFEYAIQAVGKRFKCHGQPSCPCSSSKMRSISLLSLSISSEKV